MKKLSSLKICSIIIMIFFLLVVFYCGNIIYSARKESKTLINSYLSSDKIKLRANELTRRQKEILVKVQDPNFYNHKGIDFETPGNGLTTITQSITKFLYFKKFKPGFRKLKQSLIARYALHDYASKEQQLTIFINGIWFDKNVYGFFDAAKYFYNKKCSELTEQEFISLLAMVIKPNTFNINTNPEANKNRSERIALLVSGKYKSKSLMDLYYGGNTYRKSSGKIKDWLNTIIWGY